MKKTKLREESDQTKLELYPDIATELADMVFVEQMKREH